MCGGVSFRILLCAVFALSCCFFAASLAAEVDGGAPQYLQQQLPKELQLKILDYPTSLKGYLSVLELFGDALKVPRLPLEAELEWLKDSRVDGVAAQLLRIRLRDVPLAKQKEGLAASGALLQRLVDGILPIAERHDPLFLFECCYALVVDERLDAEVWGAYADAAMNDIVSQHDLLARWAVTNRVDMILMQAAGAGALEVIRTIVSSAEEARVKIDLAASSSHKFILATIEGHVNVVEYLLAKKEENPALYGKIDPAVNGNYSLKMAAANGHVEMVEYLLGKRESDTDNKHGYQRIDPAADNNYAIRMASANGHVGVVEYLLAIKEGDVDKTRGYWMIDPTADDSYAIKAARENGHDAIVALLLSKKEEEPELYKDIIYNLNAIDN